MSRLTSSFSNENTRERNVKLGSDVSCNSNVRTEVYVNFHLYMQYDRRRLPSISTISRVPQRYSSFLVSSNYYHFLKKSNENIRAGEQLWNCEWESLLNRNKRATGETSFRGEKQQKSVKCVVRACCIKQGVARNKSTERSINTFKNRKSRESNIVILSVRL